MNTEKQTEGRKMTDDIVTRLRRDCMSLIADEAAGEIERLRSVVEAWMTYSSRAERDIAGLREERDEARRMYLDEMCLREYGDVRARIEEAGARGWSSLFADEGKHERDA